MGVYTTVHVCIDREGNPFDAYAAERHPFAKPDVGSFHDVLTLTSRGAADGRSLANSGLVRGSRKDLGLKVTCRSSHH